MFNLISIFSLRLYDERLVKEIWTIFSKVKENTAVQKAATSTIIPAISTDNSAISTDNPAIPTSNSAIPTSNSAIPTTSKPVSAVISKRATSSLPSIISQLAGILLFMYFYILTALLPK